MHSSVLRSDKTASNKTSLLKTSLTALTFCVSGSALTIFNKLAMKAFPAPNFVLLLQNVVTLMLLAVGAFIFSYELYAFKKTIMVKWLPLVMLFYGMLASSMLALESVTATTLIVQRNLGTVTIACADFVFLGTIQSRRRMLAIVCMCLGIILYVTDEVGAMTIDIRGYFWLFVNIASTTAYQIKVKSLVNELKLNSWTMSKYNNALSLPFCVLFSAVLGEQAVVTNASSSISSFDALIIAASCSLGFILSVSAFQLNRRITPTSLTVLNNTNKLVLIFFTAFFMDYNTLTLHSVGGIVIVMLAAAFYSISGARS
jgi:GDP-mannose transporter